MKSQTIAEHSRRHREESTAIQHLSQFAEFGDGPWWVFHRVEPREVRILLERFRSWREEARALRTDLRGTQELYLYEIERHVEYKKQHPTLKCRKRLQPLVRKLLSV